MAEGGGEREREDVSDRRPARGKIYDDNKLRPPCGEQDYKKKRKEKKRRKKRERNTENGER